MNSYPDSAPLTLLSPSFQGEALPPAPGNAAQNTIRMRRLQGTNGRNIEHFSDLERALRFGDFLEAHRLADIALAENPDDVNAIINKGLAHAVEGNTEQSMAYNQAVLDIDPHNEVALHNLGCDHFDLGDYKRALDYYMDSIKKGGANNALIFACIADSLSELGRTDEAMIYYEKALTSPFYSTIFIDDAQLETAERLGFDNPQDALQYVREQRAKTGLFATTPSATQSGLGILALDDVA